MVAATAVAEAVVAAATELPVLGAGLGYRAPLRPGIFQHRDRLPVLEIIADDWLDPSAEQREELALLHSHFTLIPHAIGLSLGSAEGVDGTYLEALAGLIERLAPPWWSEHISFTRASGIDIGHLTPLPHTREAVAVLARNVETVRRQISPPLILENPAATFRLPGELDEAAFIRAVSDATGCGLLLDLTNLHVNACNFAFDARAALDRLPLERVVQLHFTGGHRRIDLEIDSHSRATPEPVWALMREVCARTQVHAAILERDHHLPPISELLAEVSKADGLMKGRAE